MKALRKTLVVLLVLLMVFGTLAFSGCSLRINKTAEDPSTQTTTAPPTDKPGNQLAVVETEVPVPATTAPATDTPVATYPPESTDGEKIIITKHPSDELYCTDGQELVKFTSHARYYSEVSWEFRTSVDGTPFSIEDAERLYGVIAISNGEEVGIWNVTSALNGWQVRAKFVNYGTGEVAYSNWATIGVQGSAPVVVETPQPESIPAIVITKHPYDELSLTDGSETSFIARADNANQISWEFRIGDGGDVFSAEDAVAYYGLIIDGFNSEKIIIHNVSWNIDDWQIRAIFINYASGEVVRSNWAKINLVEAVVAAQPGADVPIPQTSLYVLSNGVLIWGNPNCTGAAISYREAGEIVTVDAENGYCYRLASGGYISKSDVTTDRSEIFTWFVNKYGTIEIVDRGNQHVYCYSGGNLLGDTDCVTGDAYSSPTPIGLYFMWYYRDHFNMQDNPLWYTTYASFFNNGIAIHGADNWRSEYGGTIYQGNGSHGCVNTPEWFAELVYTNSTIGTPVLVIP